jgi:signal transduction histidine kinase/HAMP domain-containing protein
MLSALGASLQVRLMALLLLAALPGLGLAVYSSVEHRQQATANARDEALHLVRLAAANQARLIDAERHLLIALAELPEVLGDDRAACDARLADLLQQYPRYANLAVTTPDGHTRCSGLPWTPPVRVTQRAWYQRVLHTRAFVVGNYQVGTITGKATINFAYPILDATGTLLAIVSAALDVHWLHHLLADARPPEGTTLTILDRSGTIVAQYPDPERWVGRSLPEAPLVRTVLAQGEGTADVPGLDGVARLVAFKPLVGSGADASLYTAVGIATAVVLAETHQVFVHTLTVLGVVALLGMAAAWVGAEVLILRTITGLVRAAGRVAAGDLSARTGLPHGRGELGQLAQAFDAMAQALEARQAEARRAEAALARSAERLRILREIDRAVIAEAEPEAIAGAVLRPLRELLGVPRAIVNLFDLAAGEVEWLAAVGRRRLRLGPGVRYSLRLMGDVKALQRGEIQRIDVHALPPGPDVDALLASGVEVYLVVPMIVGDDLIGALSFGGPPGPFPPEQVNIAQEMAMQLAIAITQARLHARVKHHTADLERRVQERTQELSAAHADLQHTNAALVQLTAALQAANRELEAFSYSVSHDLRAPLRSIDGFSQALLEDYAASLDAQAQDYLQRIRGATQRMAQLIDALLALSRITRVELRREDLDLTAIAQAIAADLQRQEPARQVAFVIAEGLRAAGDPRLLRVALENLLGNAWKFTATCPQACIEVGQRTQPDGARGFFVRDNGVGFDMAYADKLFGAFQRLHRASEFPGTGIGLATVQRIVHRHGGRIWAEGAVGQGATFSFTL